MKRTIKIKLLILILISLLISIKAEKKDTLYVASWNVENLFDNIDDPNKNDEEFTAQGHKEWTNERINDKMSNLASVIKYMNNGDGPDLIGFMEVEHKYLIEKIAVNFLHNKSYKVVGFESPDFRGIDNYILYDSVKLELVEYNKIPVQFNSVDYVTRDILHGLFKYDGELLDLFVNHWPSRRGGEESSQPRRISAASTLRRYIDSLVSVRDIPNIIIVGDFNDEPDNYSIENILKAGRLDESDKLLHNLALKKYEDGLGTHYYNKEFNMLDQIIISSGLLNNKGLDYIPNSFEIVKSNFFIYTEGKNEGAIKSSFGGGKYLGGYSDHLPVAAKFHFIR